MQATNSPVQDTADVPQECEACGTPGAVRETQQFYIGGRGWTFFDVWTCPDGCPEPTGCDEPASYPDGLYRTAA